MKDKYEKPATPAVSVPEQCTERNTFGWLWEKLWRWDVVTIGSPTIYGAGIAAMYGDDYPVAAVLYFAGIGWLAAKTLSWGETKARGKRAAISVLVLALLALTSSGGWILHREESRKWEFSRDQSSIKKEREIIGQHDNTRDAFPPLEDRKDRPHPATPRTPFRVKLSVLPQQGPTAATIKLTIAHQLGVTDAEVVPSARLAEDLGADILDKTELQMAFEAGYDIQIPAAD